MSQSRKGYSEVVQRQDTETFLRVIENAVRYFGGVPHLLNFGNLKAAVIKANNSNAGKTAETAAPTSLATKLNHCGRILKMGNAFARSPPTLQPPLFNKAVQNASW